MAALVAASGARADGPFAASTQTASWQDNVTNAPSGDGVRSAVMLGTGATVTWIGSIDFSTLVSGGYSANAEVCTEYSGLDSVCASPFVQVRRKFGLGPYAPSAYLGLQGKAQAYSDGERSNIEGDATVGFEERFTDSLQLQVDGRLGTVDARDIVFTGNYASIDTALNWDLDETWRFKVLAGWRSGDAVANYTAVKSPYGWIPVDPDAFYLPGAWHYVPTFHAPFVAYKVSARTWSIGAGVSPAIGPHTSVSLEVVRFYSSSYDNYADNVVSLSLSHHF
jgi:hypothetical protein